MLNWLCSYFTGRRQSVRVDGVLSGWRPVKAVVIQGSVIGPLLFDAYFDKIDCLDIEKSTCVKYADDLILITPMNNGPQLLATQIEVNHLSF